MGIDELTHLNYLEWKGLYTEVKPYVILRQVPEGVPRSNFTVEPGPEQTIHDMRGLEESFTVDDHGFAVRSHKLSLTEFNKETVEQVYLPDVERLLRQEVEGVTEVCFFDWRLRSSDKQQNRIDLGAIIDRADRAQYFGPVRAVHIDQSEYGARERVKVQLGDRAAGLMGSRVRIFNIWRPLRHPIEDYPLAVCDGSTFNPSTAVTVDVVRRGYIGEMLYPLYDRNSRWHYLRRQTKDEVLMLKMFDTDQNVRARYCPHTSFQQSCVPASASPRESIEVRALVFSS